MQNYNSNVRSDIKTRCFNFSLEVIKLCDNIPVRGSTRIISDQIVRSATSIGANLFEAKASSSRLEFKKFYEISLKSANETKYWLSLLKESKIGNEDAVNTLIRETDELCKMLASGVIKLKQKTF